MRVFHNNDGVTHSSLWELTWKRVTQFMPNLKEELFDKDPSKIRFGFVLLLNFGRIILWNIVYIFSVDQSGTVRIVDKIANNGTTNSSTSKIDAIKSKK